VRVTQSNTKKEDEIEQPAARYPAESNRKNHQHDAKADSTRITIALEAPVQYISGRIANPDRIYLICMPLTLGATERESS